MKIVSDYLGVRKGKKKEDDAYDAMAICLAGFKARKRWNILSIKKKP